MEQETFFIIAALTLITVYLVKRYGNTDSDQSAQSVNREVQYLEDKWDDICQLVNSENQNEWRIAIIETDILINTLMNLKGVQGETHVERINNLPTSFNKRKKLYNLRQMRNMVVHKGLAYKLNKEQITTFKIEFESMLESFKTYLIA